MHDMIAVPCSPPIARGAAGRSRAGPASPTAV